MSKGFGISRIRLTGATLVLRVGLIIVERDGFVFLFCRKSSDNGLGNHTTHGRNALVSEIIASRFDFLTGFVPGLCPWAWHLWRSSDFCSGVRARYSFLM